MKKTVTSVLLAGITFFLLTGVAFAHVKVFPTITAPGADDQVFTVQVPTEKKVPTISVKLKVPQGVDISGVEPISGWKASFTKDKTDKITYITWAATNGGLPPDHFETFHVVGTVSENTSALDWKAYQTYQDGTTVNWVGAEGSEHPGPVTEVTSSHAKSGHAVDFSIILSAAALLISLLALITAILKKKPKKVGM